MSVLKHTTSRCRLLNTIYCKTGTFPDLRQFRDKNFTDFAIVEVRSINLIERTAFPMGK